MSILDTLNETAVTVFGEHVSYSELVGDVAGVATVWLTVVRHVLNWPIGLVNSVFFGITFAHVTLYGDAFLQGVFFVLGVAGWWLWVRDGAPALTGVTDVRRTTKNQWVALTSAGVATFAAVYGVLRLTNDALPVRDALLLALSLVATYGQAKALVESWFIWILTDVVSVPVYVQQHLDATALVYVGFGIMCVLGLRGWQKQMAAQDGLALAA